MSKTTYKLLVLTALGLGSGVAHMSNTTTAPLLKSDAAKKTATLQLVAGSDQSNAGLNFNGKYAGQSTLTVPLGWKVELHFRNAGAMPHSVVVVQAPESGEKLPVKLSEASAAFAGAHSKNVARGVGRTAPTEVVRFTANKAGDYLIACGVTGHSQGGQYIKLHVSAEARAATLTDTP